MVERPIKKSERQAKIESGEVSAPVLASSEVSTVERTGEDAAVDAPKDTAPREKRTITVGADRMKDREPGKGKGKGRDKRDRDDADRPPANLALMRGPKPVQAKPPVEAPIVEATAESTDDAETAGTTETADS